MEGTEAGYATASGMSAIAAAALQFIRHGDHVVVSNTVYGGTFALFRDYLPQRTGLRVSFVDMTDHAAVEAAFTPDTRFLYIETMSTPR
jgi:methionine-gamma-lyase